MPGRFNKYNSDECFRAIKKFLGFTQKTGKDNLQSLSEIIAYHLDKKYEGVLSTQSHLQEVADIKEICDTKNQISQGNLLVALTATCYEYSADARIDEVAKYCPAKIMAAFHHEAVTHQDTPIQFHAHLDQLAKLSVQQRSVLLFCIKSFVPDLVFYGNFVESPDEKSNCTQLNNIIDCLTYKTSLTYTNTCLGIMGVEERRIFLASVGKASKLVVDATGLAKWSVNDWANFIDAIEQNKALDSISLNKNNLYQSCIDPQKFAYILKLLNVPHLKELNLHNNNLGKLSVNQFQQLHKAITESPAQIGLKYSVHVKKGVASTEGIFAVDKPHRPSEPIKNPPEGNMSASGEFPTEECRM